MSSHRTLLSLAAALGFASLGTACEKGPPEPTAVADTARGNATAGAGAATATGAGTPAEPVTGPIDLAAATAGVPGNGELHAELDTDDGVLDCKMYEDKAPKTVANFVALSRGLQPFKDPTTGKWVKRPVYDGITFHRIIKGFMIQGGDPTGTGTGDGGYVFPDEIWPGATHDRAGLLCMANKGPGTNGLQFFITDAPTPHLDRLGHTIFGECAPVDVVHKLASTPTQPGDRPLAPVHIKKVTVLRKPAAEPATTPAASTSTSASSAPSASAAPSASGSSKPPVSAASAKPAASK
jgi:peptidyl-prolyl cis-trans isomerase A (cyclophilin A)